MSEVTGLANPEVVDLVTEGADGNVRLVIIQQHPWTGRRSQLVALQEKVQNYLRFAKDGQLQRTYPQYRSRDVLIRLYSPGTIDERTQQLLEGLTRQAADEDVTLEVYPLPDEKDEKE